MTGCAAPRHQDQADPTQAEPSAALCRPCRLGLASDLRRLPGLHADLEHIPAVSGGDGTGLPFSEPAADCRDQGHPCADCGRVIRGRSAKCGRCRAAERECDECGRVFLSAGNRKCPRCAAVDRECTSCGKRFRGRNRLCHRCQASDRECARCGASFSGKLRLCPRCATPERECTTCGKSFRGTNHRCNRCLATERTCVTCGKTFRGRERSCRPCRSAARECVTCGRTFKSARRECDVCSGRAIAGQNARRARKHAAEVAGPLDRSVYQEVISSGPCVYCGAPATSADHVRPLARGGHEAAYNLVPACAFCNNSKHARLLTEWNPQKVARAASCSPVVAAELARLKGAA